MNRRQAIFGTIGALLFGKHKPTVESRIAALTPEQRTMLTNAVHRAMSGGVFPRLAISFWLEKAEQGTMT